MHALRIVPDFGGLPRPFWILFAGTLLNRAGGFVLLFLAVYLTDVRRLSAAHAGLIVSAYGVGAMTAGPVAGAISDRIGRRVTLIVSLLAGGASMVILGLVPTGSLFAMAAITGMLYETYRPVAAATIADVVEPDHRPRAYSLNYWAVNLGASVAPLLGSAIVARSYDWMFLADGLTTAAYGVLLLVALPETRPTAARLDHRTGAAAILADRTLLMFCLLTFGLHVVFFQFFVALPVDMRAHGVSTREYGLLMVINPVLVVLLQIPAGELIAGLRRGRVLSLASLLVGAGFGCMAWSRSRIAYAAGILLFTIGEILFAPASVSLVADMSPPEHRGAYQGAFALAFTTAFAVAPAAGGYVMTLAGAPWLWLACVVTGAVVAVGFLNSAFRR
jgi:MFS family permease